MVGNAPGPLKVNWGDYVDPYRLSLVRWCRPETTSPNRGIALELM